MGCDIHLMVERRDAEGEIELAREKARREAAELDRASEKTARGQ